MAEVLRPASPTSSTLTFPRIRSVTIGTRNLSSWAALPPSSESHSEATSRQSTSDSSLGGSSVDSSPAVCVSGPARSASPHSTPPNTTSLIAAHEDSGEDHDNLLPSYGGFDNADSAALNPRKFDNDSENQLGYLQEPEPVSPGIYPVVDDTAIRPEPSKQVDYLSHEWREEDIWMSWKHITSNRRVYGDVSRLENASWRTWAKAKFSLKTVSPASLNWLKDCDVTWLYGPLQEAPRTRGSSGPPSILSKNDSFLDKKPILKKRSVSEVMLQKSLSTSSLVRQAAAAVQAQMHSWDGRRPSVNRQVSDYVVSLSSNAISTAEYTTTFASSSSSGFQSPDANCGRHIRFDNTVEQCIAVDFENQQTTDDSDHVQSQDVESSEDELVMKVRPRRGSNSAMSSRNSFTQEGKGIAMLPSTTLKFHHEEAELPGHSEHHSLQSPWSSSSTLSPSPSQETIRPIRASANFLIDDEDDLDLSWNPSATLVRPPTPAVAPSKLYSYDTGHGGGHGGGDDDEDDYGINGSDDDRTMVKNGLRRTPSGMFMPFEDEGEERSLASGGVLGRVVDTVNTARDIAHVIWNVGWRK